MSMDRMWQLQAMLAEEPGDPFLRYAIALERRREGAMEAAAMDLEALLKDHPDHVPSYYQLAVIQVEQGRTAEAIEACEAGILRCSGTGDIKALREFKELRRSLQDE